MSNAVSIETAADDQAAEANGRPRRQRITREAIIDAAQDLFLTKGYDGTRVSEVARVADVSIGSIYVHFESKEDLYAALVERALDIEARYFDAVLENEELSDWEKMLMIGEAYLQFFREHPNHFRVLAIPRADVPAEAAETPVGVQAGVRGIRQREQLTEVLQRLVDQGILRAGTDPAATANFYWGAWNGMIALSLRQDQLRIDAERLAEVVLEGRRIVTRGIVSQALLDDDGELIEPYRSRLDELRAEVV